MKQVQEGFLYTLYLLQIDFTPTGVTVKNKKNSQNSHT